MAQARYYYHVSPCTARFCPCDPRSAGRVPAASDSSAPLAGDPSPTDDRVPRPDQSRASTRNATRPAGRATYTDTWTLRRAPIHVSSLWPARPPNAAPPPPACPKRPDPPPPVPLPRAAPPPPPLLLLHCLRLRLRCGPCRVNSPPPPLLTSPHRRCSAGRSLGHRESAESPRFTNRVRDKSRTRARRVGHGIIRLHVVGRRATERRARRPVRRGGDGGGAAAGARRVGRLDAGILRRRRAALRLARRAGRRRWFDFLFFLRSVLGRRWWRGS